MQSNALPEKQHRGEPNERNEGKNRENHLLIRRCRGLLGSSAAKQPLDSARDFLT